MVKEAISSHLEDWKPKNLMWCQLYTTALSVKNPAANSKLYWNAGYRRTNKIIGYI